MYIAPLGNLYFEENMLIFSTSFIDSTSSISEYFLLYYVQD